MKLIPNRFQHGFYYNQYGSLIGHVCYFAYHDVEQLAKRSVILVFKSITADNGSEFSRLSELEAYGVSVYFAHPYSSWERPQNEHHNRIFRRFIPKGGSIERYSAEQIIYFADEMNALPRKQLGYQIPEDLFEEFLDKVYSLNGIQVA